MCEICSDHSHEPAIDTLDRRTVLKAGAGLVAAPLLAGAASLAHSAAKSPALGSTPFTVQAYGAASATSAIAPMQISRRAVGAHDVLLDVLYCGICHSDIHSVRGDWGAGNYPIVPGHEFVGRVLAVGSAVTRFREGDIGGVGCMVDSCGTCENCLADREQNCLNGTTFTYSSADRISGGDTYGGYSDKIVVSERFVIRIPPGADLAATAPLLCAGITTFSPLQHWKLESGQRMASSDSAGSGTWR
jgi:uncharacterized zinc-type alcohol dehydrogenase-like protein